MNLTQSDMMESGVGDLPEDYSLPMAARALLKFFLVNDEIVDWAYENPKELIAYVAADWNETGEQETTIIR